MSTVLFLIHDDKHTYFTRVLPLFYWFSHECRHFLTALCHLFIDLKVSQEFIPLLNRFLNTFSQQIVHFREDFCIYYLEEKLGRILGPVLRAENWYWADIGQRQWAEFSKKCPLRTFWSLFGLFSILSWSPFLPPNSNPSHLPVFCKSGLLPVLFPIPFANLLSVVYQQHFPKKCSHLKVG